ncbi:putative N amino acid transport system protein [Glarea lozoyensis 74030]|uniref:Putative N amino acid transport system protein n=1 Tax=Glarea lozoyensis (strain ATCC 74030 / MF5533) TaxID=1104152 RepID=H0EW16_GLAL7|nr:putative N amino acid transport system protein [Glarea lozoyensis 74030]
MSNPGALALEGGDPRNPNHLLTGGQDVVEKQLVHNTHDPSVSFEEYMYYASITRAEEVEADQRFRAMQGPKTAKSILKNRFSTGRREAAAAEYPHSPNELTSEKKELDGSSPTRNLGGVSDSEYKTASRAIRTAGWSSAFFLITTDILGPFSVPSGFQLWKIFLALDSDKYPMKSYADPFFRIYGRWARHGVNLLQSVQLLLTVSALILGNGQSISQISKGTICFIACLIIFMAAGMVLGQIRTLQRFGWLANFAVWLNLLILFICMGVAANSPPNFSATQKSYGDDFGPGPIHRYAGTPPDGAASGGTGFTASLNGLNQAVYSYGGAMLFVSFMAEMRHPFDFWKGILIGNIFIYCVYLFFGVFMYSYQGQYAYNPVMQGLSPYAWQTATNIMNIITGLIAAALYGNIGIKVMYVEVLQELFHFPPLTTKRGKLIWVALVPAYWALAWVVCAAVPQFSYITGLIAAVCILQFTYTFPAILAFGFQIRKDAMLPASEAFNPETKTYSYVDTGFKRWVRGFKVKWWLNGFNFIYFLGALTTAALGIYSSAIGLKDAFSGDSVATSFGCASPA